MLECLFHPAAEKELAHLPLIEQGRIIAHLKELCRFNHPLFDAEMSLSLKAVKMKHFGCVSAIIE